MFVSNIGTLYLDSSLKKGVFLFHCASNEGLMFEDLPPLVLYLTQ